MCTRVLWTAKDQAVLVGRNMDWPRFLGVDLWALPRGIARTGMTGKNSLSWKARYGSVVAVVPAQGEMYVAVDGMNERGLAVQGLWLAESDYGVRDEARPGLSIGLWGQYYLDNFETVQDAVKWMRETSHQVVTMEFDGYTATAHLALEDASGDSAIIEFIGGEVEVYHGREYTVMSNSPTFDQQLVLMKRYEGFGGSEPLPGTTEAADRFVRAAYYSERLPQPQSYREAVASLLSVMRNVAQPFGTVDPARPNISQTIWRTVADLTNRVYYFESSLSPNIVWVKLDELDFAEGAPARKLDLTKSVDRIGETSREFEVERVFDVARV